MPVTKIKAPDDSIIAVQHPEGATINEIGNAAQIIFQQRQSKLSDRQSRIEDLVQSNPGEYDPNSDEYRDRYGAASGSFIDNLRAGAGKAFVDLGRGATQLGVEVASKLPFAELDDKASELRQQQTENRALDSDLMNSGGGLVGNIGTNVGLALAPGGLARGGTGTGANLAKAFSNPNSYRAAAASGAVQGALQPVAEDELRAVNTGAGALFGVGGRAITAPFSQNLSAGAQRAIEKLDDANVPLDVAERTGSGAAKRLAAMLDDSILTGGQREAFKETQLKAYTKAVMNTIGANSEEATPGVMLTAKKSIGKVFDDFAANRPMKADTDFFTNMTKVYEDAQGTLTRSEFKLFHKNFVDVMSSIDNGVINGSRFSRHLSRLGNLSRRADVGEHARAMEHALLDALERVQPAEVVDGLKNARGQWRNLRTIQGAIDKGEDAFISPLRLSNAVATKQNQGLSVFGQGSEVSKELSELAKSGRTILGDFANSGTPLRQQLATGSVLTGAAMAGGLPAMVGAGAGMKGIAAGLGNQGKIGDLLVHGAPARVGAPLTQLLIQAGLLQQEQQLED